MTWIWEYILTLLGLSGKKPETDVERCRRAIKLYLDTLYGESGEHDQQAEENAGSLATDGDEGLRLGGGGSMHMKLKYVRWQFSVSKGGASEDAHREWEKEVGPAFEKAGLRFLYHYERDIA